MNLEEQERSETPTAEDIGRSIAELGLWAAGFLRFDRRRKCFVANNEAAGLLGCPAGELSAADVEKTLATLPRLSPVDGGETALVRRGNLLLLLRPIVSSADETVFLVEDVTGIVGRQSSLRQQEREYRGLFENASYGIYRSSFAGRQLRANPALVQLNGYDSEREMLASVRDIASEWYVDPNRRSEFFAELTARGKVVDFVSEIYRHKTRERIWISETAWLVYDAQGQPKFVEGTLVETTERVRALEAARLQASTDALTGLANRTEFQRRLDRAIAAAAGSTLCVLLLDIDRFKDINDIYGHAHGDAVLVAFADRLKSLFCEGRCLARLGGDEFAAIVPGCADPQEALAFARSVAAALDAPVTIGDSAHNMAASIGIAQFPEHGDNATDLLRNADIALYSVKDRGRGHACLFDIEFNRVKQARHAVAQDLRGADKRGELELFYQPIIEARSSQVVGLEALMRWRHPVRGLVQPLDFIPIAEDAGLMAGFGAWAINEACRHAASLPSHIHVSVNVSATQFYCSDLPHVVAAALDAYGLAAQRLEIEVTEGVVLRNEATTLAVLEKLKALGVRIALDDFGTGYSSLSYLQRFAFDKVKIDRSFVRRVMSDPVNSAVVRAVLSIGRDLGLAVVAEGIETDAERNALIDQGCELFQGYLYGRPEPFTDTVARLAMQNLDDIRPHGATAVRRALAS